MGAYTSTLSPGKRDASTQTEPPLTDRQRQRRFEGAAVSRGFTGKIIVDADPERAVTYASQEYTDKSRLEVKSTRMVFWTQGTTLTNGSSGVAVAAKSKSNPHAWVKRAYHIKRQTNLQVPEMLALALALQIAKDESSQVPVKERPSTVVVYSPSKDALRRMQESRFVPSVGGRVVKAGVVAAHVLGEQGIELELRWMPGRMDIPGAIQSRNAAIEGAKYAPPSKGPDAFIVEVPYQGASRWAKRAKRRKEARGLFCQAAVKDVDSSSSGAVAP